MEQVVLLHIAHRQRSPQRHEGAAVRLLGVFSSMDTLTAHARKHYVGDLDVICIPLRKWAAIMQSPSQGDEEIRHLEKLRDEHIKEQQRHEHEFRENVAQQRCGSVSTQDESTEHCAPEPSYSQREEPPPIARDAEVRLQRLAIISILPDLSESDYTLQQPGLIVWGAFDNEEEARKQIKDEFATIARDVHLDVVYMYDFVITRLATGRRRIPTDNRPDAIDERRASYRRRAGRATRHSHYPQPRAGPATARSPQEIARETSCKIGQRLISPVHRAQILWQFLHAAKLMSCLLRSVLT